MNEDVTVIQRIPSTLLCRMPSLCRWLLLDCQSLPENGETELSFAMPGGMLRSNRE